MHSARSGSTRGGQGNASYWTSRLKRRVRRLRTCPEDGYVDRLAMRSEATAEMPHTPRPRRKITSTQRGAPGSPPGAADRRCRPLRGTLREQGNGRRGSPAARAHADSGTVPCRGAFTCTDESWWVSDRTGPRGPGVRP
jgi:hypothetical protein